METLPYLAQANLYWIALYACYALFLRRQTFLHWNRAYLLGSLLIAFALPLVQYPEAAPPVPVMYEVTAAAFTVGAATAAPAPLLLTWENLLWLVYGVGALVMLVRLIRQSRCLYFLVKSGDSVEMEDHTLVLLDDDSTGSFSFLHWIVISRADYELNFDTVLNHELAHVRQRHSWDILGVEVLKVFFWFNPVLILYKNALQQVHEYLADRQSVLAQTDHRDRYAEFLVSYALGGPAVVLTNSFFNPKLLKNRIAMLYKNKNSRWSLGKYAVVALLIGSASLVVASCERNETSSPKGDSEKAVNETTATETVNVQGYINGPDKKRLPNASVISEDGKVSTTTDDDGKFNLDVPAGSKLKVSAPGLGVETVEVSNEYKDVSLRINMIPGEEKEKSVSSDLASDNSARVSIRARTYNDEPIFTVVEQQPEFPGGIQAMYKFLDENIKYPEAAKRAKVQGKVFLNFVVTKEGEIKDINILKGIAFGIDEEAIRVMSKMPRWTPGMQSGKAINVRYNLPIAFKLDKKPELKTGEESKKVGMQGVSPDSEIKRVTDEPMNLLEDATQPLLVVDGKIVSDRNEKPELDPATVESINIMKDAAAIKKYGDKGKNGAVEVIMKKGKS